MDDDDGEEHKGLAMLYLLKTLSFIVGLESQHNSIEPCLARGGRQVVFALLSIEGLSQHRHYFVPMGRNLLKINSEWN